MVRSSGEEVAQGGSSSQPASFSPLCSCSGEELPDHTNANTIKAHTNIHTDHTNANTIKAHTNTHTDHTNANTIKAHTHTDHTNANTIKAHTNTHTDHTNTNKDTARSQYEYGAEAA